MNSSAPASAADSMTSRSGAPGLPSRMFSAVVARTIEQVEHSLRYREAIRARVVLGPEPPERQIQLRREHEHGQPRLKRKRAVNEPHAGRHRDERNPKGCRQLEDGTRQEADAKRL